MTGNATPPLLMTGHSWHGRKGGVENAFRYGVDYVLIDPESTADGPRLFARNRRAFAAVRDRDHGGPPGQGRGADWLREVLAAHGLPAPARIRLLTQPRILGFVFNPVSWRWSISDRDLSVNYVTASVKRS